jgi:hypothetical protein
MLGVGAAASADILFPARDREITPGPHRAAHMTAIQLQRSIVRKSWCGKGVSGSAAKIYAGLERARSA